MTVTARSDIACPFVERTSWRTGRYGRCRRPFLVRLCPEVTAELDRIALADEVSRAEVVRQILERSIAARRRRRGAQ